jgi:hypothetical protein
MKYWIIIKKNGAFQDGDRVEQETSTKKNTEDPSWRVLTLGCISMIFFIVAVIVYTA